MCYDLQQLEDIIRRDGLRSGFTYAEVEEVIEQLRTEWAGKPLFHVSGFDHPYLPLIVRGEEGKLKIAMMRWGLIPQWVKDLKEAIDMSNMTLNARGETLFEKRAFKNAVKHRRAILAVSGFYEHHHHKGKTFPYFIYPANSQPWFMACIYEPWNNPASGAVENTFSIVTAPGNATLTRIHNRPGKDGPRMPLVLKEEEMMTWLDPGSSEEILKELVKPYDDDLTEAHTVKPLRGKLALGNVPDVMKNHHYPELDEPLTLF